SKAVRREWEHALSLARPNFVRPTYWEDPLPESVEPLLPPAELRRLHFHPISFPPPRPADPRPPAAPSAPPPLAGDRAPGRGVFDTDSGTDIDFALTPSSVIDVLPPDSGSDFEVSALEGSDEFEATPLTKPSDSDVTAADPGLPMARFYTLE